MEFKVGQLVRVKSGLIDGRAYGGIYYRAKLMKPGFEGKVVLADPFGYMLKGSNVIYSGEMLEPVSFYNEEIFIYRKGNKVVARNSISLEYGEAICNPKDVFNFGYGAKLALSRLINKHLYNGRVFCIYADRSLTRCIFSNYIYEIKDGVLIGHDGEMLNETYPVKSVDELNETFSEYGKFLEVKN